MFSMIKAKPRLAEYEQIKRQRCTKCALDSFTPDAGWEDLSAGGMLKAFISRPLEGIIKRRK